MFHAGIARRNSIATASATLRSALDIPSRRLVHFGSTSPTLLLPLDNSADWTPQAGSSVANDTTNWRTSSGTNVQSVKFTKNTGFSNRTMTHTRAAIDLSGTHMVLQFYLHDEGDDNNEERKFILVRLGDSTGKFRDFYLMQFGLRGSALPVGDEGWYAAGTTVDDYQTQDVGFDLTDVTDIVIRPQCDNDGGTYPELDYSFDAMWFMPEPSTGQCCLIFDGAWDTHKQAAAYLAGKGLAATFAVSKAEVGATGRHSLAEVREIAEMGHAVICKLEDAESHATPAAKASAIAAEQRYLAINGLGEHIRFVVFGGSGTNAIWNAATRDALRPAQIDAIVLGSGGQADNGGQLGSQYVPHMFFRPNKLQTTAADADLNDCQRDLAEAISGRSQCNILLHAVTAGDLWTDFITLVGDVTTAVDAGTLDCLTVPDAYRKCIET